MTEDGEFSHRSLLPASFGFQTPIVCHDPNRITFLVEGPSVASPPGRFVVAPTAVVSLAESRHVDTLAVGVGQVYYFATSTPGAYADVPLRPKTLAAAGPSRLFVMESALDTVRVLRASTTSSARSAPHTSFPRWRNLPQMQATCSGSRRSITTSHHTPSG
jgi:hypothetical protein